MTEQQRFKSYKFYLLFLIWVFFGCASTGGGGFGSKTIAISGNVSEAFIHFDSVTETENNKDIIVDWENRRMMESESYERVTLPFHRVFNSSANSTTFLKVRKPFVEGELEIRINPGWGEDRVFKLNSRNSLSYLLIRL